MEDVVTAGTSVYESVPLLKSMANIELKALVVSVDRGERGGSGRSALDEIADAFNITTLSIITLDDIISYVSKLEVEGKPYLTEIELEKIQRYRNQYGGGMNMLFKVLRDPVRGLKP